MKLTLEGIQNRKQWEEKGYSLPQYGEWSSINYR